MHLWEDIGEELTFDELDRIVSIYEGEITCVCLMGGDNDLAAIEAMARHIKERHRLKVGWYSGREIFPSEIRYFDYIKLGPYDKNKGGLKSKTTNQRFYRVTKSMSL